MQKPMVRISAGFAVAAMFAQLWAGGFWLIVGNPEASSQAQSMHAVLTVKAAGCHKPDKAGVSARAIGIVKGQRRTIALKLEKLPEAGMYALTQQWPSEGRWVIELAGTNQGARTTTLVSAGPDGVDRLHARMAVGEPKPAEVEALLNSPATIAAKLAANAARRPRTRRRRL